MMYDEIAKSPVERNSSVWRGLDILDSLTSALADEVSRLQDKTNPITASHPTVGASEAEDRRPADSEVGARISTVADRLQEQLSRLTYLTNSIDL